MSTTAPHLLPTVYRPPGALLSPTPALVVADAPPVEAAFGDDDLITGVSLTFRVLPLGGATAVGGFEPFALP